MWPTRRAAAGFTLLELVVVMAIAGLLLAVLPFAFVKMRDTAEYRASIREVVATLRQARTQATQSGRPVVVTVDPDARLYGIGDEPSREVPESLSLRLTAAASDVGQHGRGRIRFYPDGSSTGGSIEILRPTGDGMQVRVDWLYGRISQHPAQS